MVDDISIRPATGADVPGIQRVARETWRATYAGHISEADIAAFLAGAYSAEHLRDTINRPSVDLFVAIAGEEVAGYVMAGVNRAGEGELFAIYVLPAWQRQGAGWRLWQAVTDALRIRGLTAMSLWVLTANEPARRFYERQGALAGEERDWPVGTGTIHETAYRLSLAPRS